MVGIGICRKSSESTIYLWGLSVDAILFLVPRTLHPVTCGVISIKLTTAHLTRYVFLLYFWIEKGVCTGLCRPEQSVLYLATTSDRSMLGKEIQEVKGSAVSVCKRLCYKRAHLTLLHHT